MKVTFLFSGLPHYLIALLNRLVEVHGIKIDLIIPRERGMSLGKGIKLEDDRDTYPFTVHYLNEIRGKFNKPYFENLDKAIQTISPDILVMGWPFIINYYFDFRLRRIVRKNQIFLVYREIPFMVAPKNQAVSYYRKNPVVNEDLEVENPVGFKFYPWAMGLNQMRSRYYRLADATMVYASFGIKIQESFGISPERIFLTYNSPDTDTIAGIRHRLETQDSVKAVPTRILHLGRLVKWKRVDLLIEAVSQLSDRHKGLELRIIGEGPEEPYLKRLAAQKAKKANVSFLGSIYDPELLAREIMASSIYVLAGMGGLSINEAMAYGLPVICSRCDGTEKDLVEDGINGFFFREGDSLDLASKIEILLNDPAKCKTMGDSALSTINNKINLKTVTQRYADCFEYLISGKSG